MWEKGLLINIFLAEWIKLKSTSVLWLTFGIAMFIVAVVFMSHLDDIHSLAGLNVNPWTQFIGRGTSLFAFFIATPFVILLVSSIIYIEQKANAWKVLYTQPISRSTIYFSKLLVILLLVISGMFVMTLGLFGSGYILGMKYPECEFDYYSQDVLAALQLMGHVFLAMLGIIGIQYFLSIRMRSVMAPIGIGVIGYIMGFFLNLSGTPLIKFFPYAMPTVVQDFGMIRMVNELEAGLFGLNMIEWNSIICFSFFVLLGYLLERRRNIKD